MDIKVTAVIKSDMAAADGIITCACRVKIVPCSCVDRPDLDDTSTGGMRMYMMRR